MQGVPQLTPRRKISKNSKRRSPILSYLKETKELDLDVNKSYTWTPGYKNIINFQLIWCLQFKRNENMPDGRYFFVIVNFEVLLEVLKNKYVLLNQNIERRNKKTKRNYIK